MEFRSLHVCFLSCVYPNRLIRGENITHAGGVAKVIVMPISAIECSMV